MKRLGIIVGVAVFLALLLILPAVAREGPPGEAFPLWHANPITCDAAIGAVPAGSNDVYASLGSASAEPFWVTPAGSTTGPWAFALKLGYHVDVYQLVDGGPGAWLWDYGKTNGKSTGLGPVVTCHNGGPYEFEPGQPVWVEFQMEAVALR
jgi:hypothetical protein